MWQWLIPLVLSIILLGLSIWQVLRTEKSYTAITINVLMVVIIAATSIINYIASVPDASNQRIGLLKPKKVIEIPRAGQAYIKHDQYSELLKIKIKPGIIIQPLGEYIPFSIKKEKEGLSISVIIYDWDAKLVAEIRNNKWIRHPYNSWKFNFDESAFEIIDQYRIPVFQIEYIDAETLRFGGIFRTSKLKVSEEYKDFPCASKDACGPYEIMDSILLWGANEFIKIPSHPSDSEVQDILADARKLIKPWFDYSNPDNLGKRLSASFPETLKLSILEKNKYAKYSNSQLAEKTKDVAGSLHYFSVTCKEKSTAVSLDINDIGSKSQGEIAKLIDEHSAKVSQIQEEFLTAYKLKFQKDVIILRDTILDRLAVEPRDYFAADLYESPPNTNCFSDIASDLERLAQKVSESR